MSSKKDRIITVDGISYSLDTGKTVVAKRSLDEHVVESVAQKNESVESASKGNVLDLRHFAPEPPKGDTVDPVTKPLPASNEASAGTVLPDRTKTAAVDHASVANSGESTLASDNSIEPSRHQPAKASPRRLAARGFFSHVMVAPFARRPNRYVVQGFLLSSMISPLYWFLALTPALFVRLVGVQQHNISDLLTQARSVLEANNYYKIAFLLGLFLILSLSSLLVSYLVRVVARTVQLRLLDHRPVAIGLLYRQAMNKSGRALLNWFLNLLLVVIISASLGGLIWWLVHSGQAVVVSNLSLVMSIVVVVWIVMMVLLLMRWTLSLTMIGASSKSVWFVQGHSLKLAFGSFIKSLLSGLWLAVISLVTLLAVGMISWAEVIYLNATQHKYAQVIIFVTGAILILVALVIYRIWKNIFIACFYHFLASIRGKAAMSSYLSLEKPAGGGITPFVLLSIVSLVLVVGYGTAAYFGHDKVAGYTDSLRNKVPASLELKIPRPTSPTK